MVHPLLLARPARAVRGADLRLRRPPPRLPRRSAARRLRPHERDRRAGQRGSAPQTPPVLRCDAPYLPLSATLPWTCCSGCPNNSDMSMSEGRRLRIPLPKRDVHSSTSKPRPIGSVLSSTTPYLLSDPEFVRGAGARRRAGVSSGNASPLALLASHDALRRVAGPSSSSPLTGNFTASPVTCTTACRRYSSSSRSALVDFSSRIDSPPTSLTRRCVSGPISQLRSLTSSPLPRRPARPARYNAVWRQPWSTCSTRHRSSVVSSCPDKPERVACQVVETAAYFTSSPKPSLNAVKHAHAAQSVVASRPRRRRLTHRGARRRRRGARLAGSPACAASVTGRGPRRQRRLDSAPGPRHPTVSLEFPCAS